MFRKHLSGLRSKKEKIYFLLILIQSSLLLIFASCYSAQKFKESDFYSPATLKDRRISFLNKTIEETILSNLRLPLSDSTEENYKSAFWAMELIQYTGTAVDSKIESCFINLSNRSIEFQRSFLEIIYSLYKNRFIVEVNSFSEKTNNPKIFAMCVNYLKESLINSNEKINSFLDKYPEYRSHPIIIALLNDFSNIQPELPPLEDLFSFTAEDKIIIYSLQRSNRDYPGLLVIKKPDGSFLRDDFSEIFTVPQLARAITDLPGYLTNGNTPEGILSIQGIDFSKNIFIGPSPNLQLVLPHEVSPKKYFHSDKKDSLWSKDYYKEMLPQSWKNYSPIFEAYYAGMAGRNEIIAHGTTIDPGFYSDETYFPFTPSLGCLTTKEIWSEASGKIIESDQLKLMNALSELRLQDGYFFVVDIDDKPSPVTLNEIKHMLIKSERE
ncbi:MAG: hypothetical protein HXY49_04005 [Ignavibacteriaceae bacterium]|nr:hypothetical protein [Ignavibacteriaceae bacterium]